MTIQLHALTTLHISSHQLSSLSQNYVKYAPITFVTNHFSGPETAINMLCVSIRASAYVFSALMLLVGWQEGHEWWGAGMVVWSKMQTCIWPSWCHCHSLSLASVKSTLVLVLLFWYRLTRVVPDKGPLNGCVCACTTTDEIDNLSPRYLTRWFIEWVQGQRSTL